MFLRFYSKQNWPNDSLKSVAMWNLKVCQWILHTLVYENAWSICAWMDLFSIHDFITSWLDYLKHTGSLSGTIFTEWKRSSKRLCILEWHLLIASAISSEKSSSVDKLANLQFWIKVFQNSDTHLQDPNFIIRYNYCQLSFLKR